MKTCIEEKAVVGRRITFTRYRDLGLADPPAHPGTITRIIPDQGASLKIRLDGRRSSLHVPPDYQGLRYLDEVIAVPPLPMGRFHPTPEDLEGEWEGVPVCTISEEGALVALTDDPDKAVAAVNSYRKHIGGRLYDESDAISEDDLDLRWAYFEWQPEDSELDWYMHFADEGDDQALPLHYLPA